VPMPDGSEPDISTAGDTPPIRSQIQIFATFAFGRQSLLPGTPGSNQALFRDRSGASNSRTGPFLRQGGSSSATLGLGIHSDRE
jgi:hypothetical protein